MKKQATIFYWGFLISWAGTLPPGLFTITASQMASAGDHPAAWQFSAGAVLAEAVVVRLALGGIHRLSGKKKFFRLLEWMGIGLLLLFAMACFVTALRGQDFGTITGKITRASFLTGFLLSLINPLHIPFWMGWTLLLLRKEILRVNSASFNWFVTGIGAGALLGFWIFIDAGAQLLRLFRVNQSWIQYGLGFLLLWVAVFQIRKRTLRHTDRSIITHI
jgi:threonine/homoserine/homoserine lactone efflux protein